MGFRKILIFYLIGIIYINLIEAKSVENRGNLTTTLSPELIFRNISTETYRPFTNSDLIVKNIQPTTNATRSTDIPIRGSVSSNEFISTSSRLEEINGYTTAKTVVSSDPKSVLKKEGSSSKDEEPTLLKSKGALKAGNVAPGSKIRKYGRNSKKSSQNKIISLAQKNQLKGYIRDDGTYILEDTAGIPCVLTYFKAKITVYFPTDVKSEKYSSAVLYPPDDVQVSGKCNRDTLVAVISISWDDGTFSLGFAFDDITDSWYVKQFSFAFDTSKPAYSGAFKKETVELKSRSDKRYWTTSHAKSFRCLLLHDITLKDKTKNYTASVHFDEVRVQALSKSKTFKTPKHCIHRVHRSEMVPALVTGLLAASSLLTIAAYGVFRYLKIKKFQYGTME